MHKKTDGGIKMDNAKVINRRIQLILALFVLLMTIGETLLLSACSPDKETMITETTTLISPVTIICKNDDNYDYKENKALREFVDMFIGEGLQISLIDRVYDESGHYKHQITMVDEQGEVKQVITDVDGLTGVLSEYKFSKYEGVEIDDCYVTSDLEFHPVSKFRNGKSEYFIEDKVIVTTYR